MSSTGTQSAVLAQSRRRIWSGLAVPALLLPPLWYLLEMLAQPDQLVAFYAVSIGAVPLAFFLVVRPAWRIAVNAATTWWQRPLVVLVMLPSAAILLWGVYCAVWLAVLFAQGEL